MQLERQLAQILPTWQDGQLTQARQCQCGGPRQEELTLTRDWLRSRANSIEGGTTEIQLNIIAKRVLALPD